MKKSISSIIIMALVLIFTLAFVGCANTNSEQSEGEQSQVEESEQPKPEESEQPKSEESDNSDSSSESQSKINNPAENVVIECLQKIEGILDIEAATEDHDPNEKLHKQGGYTSAVYFSYDKIDQTAFEEQSVVDKGTSCGGQIEVYASVEEAETRNTYLAAFDGTIFSSGYHEVLGTMVIRISDELTASEQTELSQNIINAFTK